MKELAWYREPTRQQWATFTAAWAGWVLDAFDFTIFLLVMPAIAREFGASMTAVTSVVTLTLVVRLAGGALAGAAADRWGRKSILMASIVWFAVCDGAVAFAPSFGWVIALRVLFGFGMGAEWTGGTTLAMENWPERSRGIASGILQGSWAIGFLLAAVVSAAVVPIWGWRALFLIAAAPALLVIPIRFWVPESKEWKRDREKQPGFGMSELLQPDVLKRLLWASAGMTLGFGVYYALTALYPTLLGTVFGMDEARRAPYVVLFNVGMMLGAIAAGIAANRWGVTVAVVVPALAFVPLLPLYVGAAPDLLWLGALLGGALGVGWAGVVPAFLTGLFPAHVRGRAVGITYHVGAFFAAFVATAIAALWERGGVSLAWSMALFAGACVLGLVAVLMLGPREISGRESAPGAAPARA